MMTFLAGLFLGGSFGVLIAGLMASAGRSSEEDRAQRSYTAGVKAGRRSMPR